MTCLDEVLSSPRAVNLRTETVDIEQRLLLLDS
jgi:hypothetical protein